MTGIYNIVDGKIYLHRHAVELCPQMSRLKEELVKYLIMVYDYVGSPLKGQPLSKRKEMAVSFFFQGEHDKKKLIENIEGSEIFKEAVEELQAIIFDIERSTYDTYLERINQLNIEVKSAPLEKIKNYMLTTSMLREEAEKLRIKIERNDVTIINIELKGNRKLSLLEQWRLNKEQFNRFGGSKIKEQA
jgi:hypothetical protein